MNLSDFLTICDKQGELIRVSASVATDLELAAISRREFARSEHSNALLFDRPVPGNFPVVTNMFASETRMAAILRTTSLANFEQKVQAYLGGHGAAEPKADRPTPTLPSVQDQIYPLNGSCRLSDLPALKCWPEEGKPYFTLALTITNDPVSGRHNFGLYRVQRIDDKTLAINFSKSSDAYAHLMAAGEQGTTLPVCLVLGCDPVLMWAAAAPLPAEVDDLAFCRKFFNEDFPQMKLQDSRLLVPDSAELVISGYISPGEICNEGPFGNHTGTYASRHDCPLMRVTSIQHRNNAIIPFTVVGPPPSENIWLAAANEILIRQLLKQQYSDISHMVMPLTTIFHGVSIIAVSQPRLVKVRQLIHSLWQSGPLQHARLIIIVDDDINPVSLESCWWRVINRLEKLPVYHSKQRIAIDASGVDAAALVVEDEKTRQLIKNRQTDPGYYPY